MNLYQVVSKGKFVDKEVLALCTVEIRIIGVDFCGRIDYPWVS